VGSYPIQAAANDGDETAGVFTPGSNPMSITTATTDFIGLHFTLLPFATFTDTGTGGPAISRTNATTTMTAVNLVAEVNPSAGGTMTVLFQDDTNDPPPYANAANLKPSDRTFVTAATTALSAGLQTVTVPLFTQAATVTNFTRYLARHRSTAQRVDQSGFAGRVNFSVQWSGAGTLQMTPLEAAGVIPTLTTTELPEVTGINKHWDAHSRADRCPRCGTLTVRQLLVEDGFKRGLLVCQSCWDPPDYHSQWNRRDVGREREGVNN
jgi:hypothetical protein